MLKRVAVGAVVVSLALAGCSVGGGGASSSPTVEVSETATTTALPPLEYEAPPVYPENMEVDSGANATRFVEFAIETLNYAQRFSDAEALQAISDPECQFCNAMIEVFTCFHDQGLRLVGGEISCTVTSVEYQPETGIFFLFSDCTTTTGTTYSAAGDVLDTLPAERARFLWAVTMVIGPWQLVNASTDPEEVEEIAP